MINSLSETSGLWNKALEEIGKKLDEPMMFESFFSGSYIYDINGNTITVVVNSSLAAQLLQTKYYDVISETINELTETEFQIKFIDIEEANEIKEKALEEIKQHLFIVSMLLFPYGTNCIF